MENCFIAKKRVPPVRNSFEESAKADSSGVMKVSIRQERVLQKRILLVCENFCNGRFFNERL